jgi:hypothetical protein
VWVEVGGLEGLFVGVRRRKEVTFEGILVSLILNLDDVMNSVVAHDELQKSIIQSAKPTRVFIFPLNL